MASLSKQYHFSPGEVIESNKVNVNFDDLVAFVNNQLVHADGSKAFTSIPILPATNPTNPNHAVRKAYVDAATNVQIGFAMHAVTPGTLSGGAPPDVGGNTKFKMISGTASVTVGAGSNATVVYPVAFPGGVSSVVVTNGDAGILGNVPFSVVASNNSNFGLHVPGAANGQPVRVNFIAIGW